MYENSFESKIYDIQTWKYKMKISDNKSLHHCITLHGKVHFSWWEI